MAETVTLERPTLVPDDDAVARLEAEGEPPVKRFVFSKAQLMSVTGEKGSSASGAKGRVRFVVGRQELAPLMVQGYEDTAFDVTYGSHRLGIATISSTTTRSDADGRGIGSLLLVYPSTEMKRLAVAYAKDLFGHEERLVLSSEQLQFDLTARAE